MREPVYTELTAAQRAERTRGLIVGVEEKLHDCDNNIAINLAIAAARQDRAEGRQVMVEVEKLRRDRTGFLTALPVLRARHARELELVEPPPVEEEDAVVEETVGEGATGVATETARGRARRSRASAAATEDDDERGAAG